MCDEWRKRCEKRARVRLRLVHLPIAGDHRPPLLLARAHDLFVSASTPGSFSPAKNSREAPPPVEMCEIFEATPLCSTAATESPPPTIEVAPATEAAATARAIAKVPCANAGFSKIPKGP